MLPTPEVFSLFPSDMAVPSTEITSILAAPLQNNSTSFFISSLCSCQQTEKNKPISLRRVPKRNSTDQTAIEKSSYVSYYLPNVNLQTKVKKKSSKEIAEKIGKVDKKNKKKQFDQSNIKSSYRKLSIQRQLESHIESHFILNHKFMIMMFGRVGSVGKASDDEGSEIRMGNPLYNIDIINKKVDDIADIDIQSDQLVAMYLNSFVQDHQKAQQLRKSSISNLGLLNSIIQERCIYYSTLFKSLNKINQFPLVQKIDFDSKTADPINYVEYIFILSILMNIECFSTSLRVGLELQTNLSSYLFLIRSAMKSPKSIKYHLVCDPIIAKFIFTTHQIIHSLLQTLLLPCNWKFSLIIKFFKEQRICLNDILDDLTTEFSKSIDNGSWFAREIIRFRELACAVDLHLFGNLVHDECSRYESKPYNVDELVRLSRGYSSYENPIGIKIIFNKKGEISLKQEIIDTPKPHHLFPIFNMFDGNCFYYDASSVAPILY